MFGARSSPSCANFALRHAVLDSELARKTVLNSLYVGDVMVSLDNVNTAIALTREVTSLLHGSGFNLTGFVSNSREVLSSIPSDKLSKELKTVNVEYEKLPHDRALGVVWNVEDDTLGFRIAMPDQPCTKRGILSSIFSVYVPFFTSSPVIIVAKRIFQEVCTMKVSWDDELPEKIEDRWNAWRRQIKLLNSYEIPRCYNRMVTEAQLRIFCDGSETAYGAVAYL